jgi:K+-sensing histidine kinase KdpD
LRDALGSAAVGEHAISETAAETPSEPLADRFSEAGLRRLKTMSDRLRDPSVRGEVLSLILEFAAETFSRVAIFMVRDDTAVGMAQRGFDLADGPDDDGLRGIELPVADVACFRRVLESRSAHRAPLGEADQVLISRLGARVLAEAYVAPIESGGRIVALLYADSASESLSTADTTILEAALHEAGLALERALLERTLAPAAESGDV